jgi:hypothetical protein
MLEIDKRSSLLVRSFIEEEEEKVFIGPALE